MVEILKYLLDTNIISELRKGERCDLNVQSWFESVEQSQLLMLSCAGLLGRFEQDFTDFQDAQDYY